MTPKQMYSELARIAGGGCISGNPFVTTPTVTEAELRKAQRGMMALLEKLNYARSSRDFGYTTDTQGDRLTYTPDYPTRARRMAQATRMVLPNHASVSFSPDPLRAVSPLEEYERMQQGRVGRALSDEIFPWQQAQAAWSAETFGEGIVMSEPRPHEVCMDPGCIFCSGRVSRQPPI